MLQLSELLHIGKILKTTKDFPARKSGILSCNVEVNAFIKNSKLSFHCKPIVNDYV